MYLASARSIPKKRIERQVKFSGLDHRPGREDGSLYDMRNLTGRDYPVLATRSRRARCEPQISNIRGFGYFDKPFWVSGTRFVYDGKFIGNVSAGVKRFTEIGQVIIILPDKKYYNIATDVFGDIDTVWSGRVTYADGTYAGQPALANTLISLGAPFSYEVMDTVVISGNTGDFIVDDKPAGVTVVEVSADHMELKFMENTFSELGTTTGDISVSNTMPELDIIFESGNRLWGAKGDTVYCSRLDDFRNWTTFFGVATDSWSGSTRGRGDFTGGIAYKGYPTFFKEQEMLRVYGSSALDYELLSEGHIGVKDGAADSLAIAAEALFYYSPDGFAVSYGGTPQLVGAPLGDNLKFTRVVSAGDSTKYWAATVDSDGVRRLYVFNTALDQWYIEDDFDAVAFDYDKGKIFGAEADGNWWIMGEQATPLPPNATLETSFDSFVEFADYTTRDVSKLSLNKALLEIDFPGSLDSRVSVFIRYDHLGEYQKLCELTPKAKRAHKIPIIPRRRDHFQLLIEGYGDWRVYNLTYLFLQNSHNRSADGGMMSSG